jgi:hypothetical protein
LISHTLIRDVSTGEHFGGLPHEQRKQQKLLRRQVEALAIPRGAVPGQIQFESTYAQSHLRKLEKANGLSK